MTVNNPHVRHPGRLSPAVRRLDAEHPLTTPVDLPAPFGAAWAKDPWEEYARLRASGGITRITIRPGLRPWVVTSHQHVRTLLADPRLSANADNTTEEVRAAIRAGQPEERVNLIGRNLLTLDPPDHTRLRRLVSSALSAQRMAAMEGPVRQTADRLLDGLVGRDEVDLLAEYAVPLAVTVACMMMGIPKSEHDQFCEWSRALIRAELHTAEAFDEVSDAMRDYFIPFIHSRRCEPGDDLVSILAIARNENQIDDYELLSVVFQLFFAGHETTAHFLANAILALLEHPAERAMVAADPDALDAAVQELLRFEGPVKATSWRFATEPINVGGVTIEPGEPVLTLVAAANRDEALVTEPDRFRLDRSGNQHLSFSHGIHHCLGAALGRIEARVGIGRLLARFPEVSLVRPAEELPWRVNLVIRGVSELPVRMGAPDYGA